jgi:hypothetical protein
MIFHALFALVFCAVVFFAVLGIVLAVGACVFTLTDWLAERREARWSA